MKWIMLPLDLTEEEHGLFQASPAHWGRYLRLIMDLARNARPGNPTGKRIYSQGELKGLLKTKNKSLNEFLELCETFGLLQVHRRDTGNILIESPLIPKRYADRYLKQSLKEGSEATLQGKQTTTKEGETAHIVNSYCAETAHKVVPDLNRRDLNRGDLNRREEHGGSTPKPPSEDSSESPEKEIPPSILNTYDPKKDKGPVPRGKIPPTPVLELFKLYQKIAEISYWHPIPEDHDERNRFAKLVLKPLMDAWREYPDLEWWERYFKAVSDNPGIQELVETGKFIPSLPWLLERKTISRYTLGQYTDGRIPPGPEELEKGSKEEVEAQKVGR